MKRARQKLHSRRGASILLALLLMLVAVMISAVIISAASTAVKRVGDDRTQAQNELNISSAGRLFAEALKHSSVTYRYELFDGSKRDETYVNDGPLGSVLMAAVEAADENSEITAKNPVSDITIDLPNSIPDATLTNITMQKRLDANADGTPDSDVDAYRLTGKITVADSQNKWVMYFTSDVELGPSIRDSWVQDPSDDVYYAMTPEEQAATVRHTIEQYHVVLTWQNTTLTMVG